MSILSDTDLDKQTVTTAYARWAPVYDLVFGAVFDRGRKASIAAGENPLLRSLRRRVCSGGSMKINHNPSMRASSLNSAWRLRGKANNCCCARLAEHLGSFAIAEHSAWLNTDHTAHLLPTST